MFLGDINLIKFDDFESLCEYVNLKSTDELVTNLFKEQLDEYFKEVDEKIGLEGTFNQFFDDLGNPGSNYFRGRISDIKNHLEEYKRFYTSLPDDDSSRSTYFNIIAYELTGDINHIIDAYCKDSEQYFIESLIDFDDISVYADCGGLDGKTTIDFISKCQNYKSIYLYEPMPVSYQECLKNMQLIDSDNRIHVRNNAVLDQNCTISFLLDTIDNASSRKDDHGDLKVSAVTLDDDISEPVDFIKMDIEGSELQAIKGAAQHIKNDNPYLAICAYHKDSDLWEIPKKILDINPDYKFALRHHSAINYNETVIYGIPVKREKKAEVQDAYDHDDNKWLKCEINRLKLSKELDNAEKEIISNSRIWLFEQYYNLHKELKKQNGIIEELRDRSVQLNKAKEYFINQLEIEKAKNTSKSE
jgi:FkbM family methyltransferase